MSLETARLLAMVPEMHAFLEMAMDEDAYATDLRVEAQRILAMIREGRP